LGARFLAMAFRSDVWFLPIARDIEADLMWVHSHFLSTAGVPKSP